MSATSKPKIAFRAKLNNGAMSADMQMATIPEGIEMAFTMCSPSQRGKLIIKLMELDGRLAIKEMQVANKLQAGI